LRHENLDAVDERRREVQRGEVGSSLRTAGSPQGVRDPRPVTQAVETGSPYLTDDMDDENGTRRRLGDGLERSRGDLSLPRRADLRQPLADERQQRERDADADDRGRSRDGKGHQAMLAANLSRVVHVSVERARKPPT
jgi:hypothetical protein